MTLSMLAEIWRRAGEREFKMAAGVNFLTHFCTIFVVVFFRDEGRKGEIVRIFFFFA